MEPDLDATIAGRPRSPEPPRAAAPDLADTVERGAVPPPLVEPPAPAPRDPVADATALLAAAGETGDPGEAAAPLRALLPDGTEIELDVPVYLGRRPSAPRIHGGPEPRLVTVPSPGRELSATHLELRVVGGALVASDMLSTNGTVVLLPGVAARTLIRGESSVVVPGTRIDLGEGVVIEILPPAGTERR